MRTRRQLTLLVVLTLLGAGLRVWALGNAPPGLHPDEAANAFEAYCVRTTGAASDGRSWPWTFSMHGRFWVEGSYVWVVALLQGLPLSLPVSTRLPAALAGIALIPSTWLLARRLVTPRWAWLAAGLIAIEPLAVHTSRVGLRASLIPPLLTLGVALLLARPQTRQHGLLTGLAGGALAALALWTYTPQRAWVPLLGLALLVTHARRVRREPQRFALAAALPLLVLLLSLPWTLTGQGSARLSAVSVFAQEGSVGAGGLEFLRCYVLGFAPRTLFSGSSSRGFWAEGVNPLLWLEAPLIVVGVGSLIVRARRGVGEAGPARARFLLCWLALYPLPGALTAGGPNPLRSIGVLPLWALLGAEGVRCGVGLARRLPKGARVALLTTLLLALALNAGVVLKGYFTDFPSTQRRAWFTEQNVALEELLLAADAARADVVLTCAWVEAALAQCAGREWSPTVEHGARARVRLTGGGAVTWVAELTDTDLVAHAGGRVVFSHPLR